jgi:hypothetical protein
VQEHNQAITGIPPFGNSQGKYHSDFLLLIADVIQITATQIWDSQYQE